jgi:hypothetical protein
MPACKALAGHALAPHGGCKAARCVVLSRPDSHHYRGSLRPSLASFSLALRSAT